MKSKFWMVLSFLIVMLLLAGVAGVSGMLGSGEAVQAAGTPRLSIPAAAFTPWKAGEDFDISYPLYNNHGRYLQHFGSHTNPAPPGNLDNHWYIAPIYLPDGVTLTKVIAHWYQENPVALGQFKLQRSEFGKGNFVDMAVVSSGGTIGFGSTSTATISQAVVDNSLYAYWVLFYLPVSRLGPPTLIKNVWGCGAQIEYSSAIYLPAIAK